MCLQNRIAKQGQGEDRSEPGREYRAIELTWAHIDPVGWHELTLRRPQAAKSPLLQWHSMGNTLFMVRQHAM